MIVHFPIVLFLGAAGFDLLSYAKPDPFVERAGWWILSLALLTTGLAVASGYLAEALVHWPAAAVQARIAIAHMERWGWITLGAGTATWSLRTATRPRRSLGWHLASTGLLWGTIMTLTLTTRAGATLVLHGWLRSLVPSLPTAIAVTVPGWAWLVGLTFFGLVSILGLVRLITWYQRRQSLR